VAVLPLAAIEQHGNHLPVVTDTALVSELARRTEAILAEDIVLLPTLWPGCSHHHLGFPGTLSISSETYVRLLCDLLEGLLATGFQRIFLLNGHGGNQTPFAEALYRIGLQRREAWIAAQSYWKLAAPELAANDFMESSALSHACEFETSMMLSVNPHIVKMDHAEGSKPGRGSAYYDPLGYSPSRVCVTEMFDHLSRSGALGSPELATPEKGEKLFSLLTASVVSFLKDFQKWPLPKPQP
jgi:creatinine amidohydrolase